MGVLAISFIPTKVYRVTILELSGIMANVDEVSA
jgi:hypothetical protein